MLGEQTFADVELRFRPRGAGRFGSAAFLSFWLCGWAAGEAFALFMIGHGIYSLVTGRPALGSEQPVRLGPALAVGCFLAVWLTLWTVGGIMAIRELLRSLWAEDRLVLDREVLTRFRRLGPFVFTRRLARSEIRRVFVQQSGSRPLTLMAQLGAGVTELTDLGTQAERDEAAQQLRTALGLAEESASTWPAALPEEWQVITESRGDILLVPNLQTRRKQALVVSVIAIVVWTVLVLLAWESSRQSNLWAVTAMVSVLAVWLARQTVWMHRGRKEWRIEHGKLIHQRRFGAEVTELAEARALELTESSDSDGDRWYELRAIEVSPPAFARAGKIPQQLKIDRAIHDPTAPRCLGLWLSQRAGIPFHDRVPTEADKQAEIARLKDQLANSGKFGRFAARLIDRANRTRLVLVLLLLAGGCGRDYIMPPAKVKLPGYQVVGLYSEGLCVISEREEMRRGYMDLDGRIVIPPKYFAAGSFSGGLAAVQETAWDSYGYINRQGRTVIAPRFDAAVAFVGNLAAVQVGGRWGFIDRQGRDVVPPRFDAAFAFADGRARVVVAGFAGFIDEDGKAVVEPKYLRAEDCHEGLAMVCDGRRCGFIDRAGQPVIALQYDDAGSFADGLAPVRQGALWGYINREGRMVIAPTFDRAEPFSEGLARVARFGDWPIDRKSGGGSGRKKFYGFINREGREVLRTDTLGTEPFVEGRTRVTVPVLGFTTDATDVRLIDTNGAFLPGRFRTVSPFREGRAVVMMNTGQKSYVIDRQGRPLIELENSHAGDTADAGRNSGSVRYGYIDPAGRTVLQHVWITAQPFSEGLAFVESPFENRRHTRGYVDATGKLVLAMPDTICQALPFTDGLAMVSKCQDGPSRYGYMDRTGQMRIGFKYANAAPFRDGLAAVKFSDGLSAYDWGYIDTNGTVAIAPRFKDAGSFAKGVAYVEAITNGNWIIPAVINRTGAVVVDKPFLFEWSGALFGVPSVEQFRKRQQMIFDDLLIPRCEGTLRGYVDTANRLVIQGKRFQTMRVFREGRAPVSIAGRDGYIDTTGNLVVEPRFAMAGPFSEGLAAVRDEAGRTGYIKTDGTWAVEPLWLEEAHPFAAGRARVKLNGRFGYLDATGRFVIPPQYLRAEDFREGLAVTAIPAPSKVD